VRLHLRPAIGLAAMWTRPAPTAAGGRIRGSSPTGWTMPCRVPPGEVCATARAGVEEMFPEIAPNIEA
jgi:hypothetical protein